MAKEEFAKVLDENKKCYNSIFLRSIAVKDSAWRNLYSKILFSYVEQPESECKIIQTKHLVVVDAHANIDKVLSIIHNLSNGVIKFSDLDVLLDIKIASNETAEFEERKRAQEDYGLEWPFFHIAKTPDTDKQRLDLIRNLEREINEELKLLKEPWTDIYEIFSLLGARGTERFLEVFLPVYDGVIRHCKLDDNELKIHVEFHKSVEWKGLDVGYIFRRREGGDVKGSMDLVEPKCLNKYINFSELVIPCPSDTTVSMAYLRKKGKLILDESSIWTQRYSITHQIFDKFCGENEFGHSLFKTTDREKFEWAVMCLLSLAGFNSIWLKDYDVLRNGKTIGGIDGLALFTPEIGEPTIMLVGCTTGIVKDDIEIIENVKTKLKEGVKNVTLAPVIFTSKYVTSGMKELAEKSNIVLIGPDEMKSMSDLAKKGETVETIYRQVFKSRIV